MDLVEDFVKTRVVEQLVVNVVVDVVCVVAVVRTVEDDVVEYGLLECVVGNVLSDVPSNLNSSRLKSG